MEGEKLDKLSNEIEKKYSYEYNSDVFSNDYYQFLEDEFSKASTLDALLKYFYEARIGEYKTEHEVWNRIITQPNQGAVYKVLTKLHNEYDVGDEIDMAIMEQIKIPINKRKLLLLKQQNNAKEEAELHYIEKYEINNDFFYFIGPNDKSFKVKLYIPIEKEDYINDIIKIMEILHQMYQEDCKQLGNCKFRLGISNDNGTFRMVEEAVPKFIKLLDEKTTILSDSKTEPNMLLPTMQTPSGAKVGVMPDFGGSYLMFSATIIEDYVNYCVSNKNYPNLEGLSEYANNLSQKINDESDTSKCLKRWGGFDEEGVHTYFTIFNDVISNQIVLNEQEERKIK